MAQYVQLEAECPVISWNALSVWRLGWGHEWWIGQKVRLNLLELNWALTKELGTTWAAKGKNLCKSYLSTFVARFELIFINIEVLIESNLTSEMCKMCSAIKSGVIPIWGDMCQGIQNVHFLMQCVLIPELALFASRAITKKSRWHNWYVPDIYWTVRGFWDLWQKSCIVMNVPNCTVPKMVNVLWWIFYYCDECPQLPKNREWMALLVQNE